MGPAVVEVLQEQTVIATLQPGPTGKVRLSYECPRVEMSHLLRGFLPSVQMRHAYQSSVIEIDRNQLRALKFTQQELAEIGFSLVARLSALVRYSDSVRDA
jgi:hypothetical protein